MAPLDGGLSSFLEVVEPRALDPVHEGPAKAGSFAEKRGHRLSDEDRGMPISSTQVVQPVPNFTDDLQPIGHGTSPGSRGIST